MEFFAKKSGSPIRAVIFDYDNTLNDWFRTQIGYYRFFAGKYLPAENPDEVVRKMANFSDKGRRFIKNWGPEAISYWGLSITGDDMIAERHALHHTFTVPMKGATEILDYLRPKYRLAIITNGDSDVQRRRINSQGIQHYFDTIVVSGDVGFDKPDIRVFNICLRNLDIAADEAVMIGDDYENDICGALNAGVAAIRIINDGYEDGLNAPGVPEIRNLAGLRSYL